MEDVGLIGFAAVGLEIQPGHFLQRRGGFHQAGAVGIGHGEGDLIKRGGAFADQLPVAALGCLLAEQAEAAGFQHAHLLADFLAELAVGNSDPLQQTQLRQLLGAIDHIRAPAEDVTRRVADPIRPAEISDRSVVTLVAAWVVHQDANMPVADAGAGQLLQVGVEVVAG